MSEDVIFELSDIEVETLGLVNQGANREEFFLMKNADGQDVLEPTEATITDAITKTIWQKFTGLFQKAAQDVMSEDMTDNEDKEEEDMSEDTMPAQKSVETEPATVAPIVVVDVVETAKVDIEAPPVDETETVATVTKEDIQMEDTVISTGGGVPCFYNNLELINKHGISIYLKMKPEDLLKRLKGSKYERPLIRDLSPKELDQYIRDKLKERESHYLKSKYVIDGSHPDVPGILEMIVAEET